MDRQFTGGRITSKKTLELKVMIWPRERNEEKRKIKWTVLPGRKADKMLSRQYVS